MEARAAWSAGALPEGFRVVTKRQPTAEEWQALRFAWRVCAHVKSNTVIFTDAQRTLAVGAGQMSRVDAVNVAIMKARDAKRSLSGSAAASDAFFPFRDGLDAVASAGATAVVQPGGSVKDNEVIAAADEHGLAMVFTGRRHFRSIIADRRRIPRSLHLWARHRELCARFMLGRRKRTLMPTPFESATLNLRLFELRREPVLREARGWYFAEFNPETFAEFAAIVGGERNASFRMVLGYWDMAASLVTTGAIDAEAFRAAHGEIVSTFAKVQPFLAELRSASGEPEFRPAPRSGRARHAGRGGRDDATPRRDSRHGESQEDVSDYDESLSGGRERQRDENQEQHQELGVPEVVLEHPGGEHRHHRGEAPRRPGTAAAGSRKLPDERRRRRRR